MKKVVLYIILLIHIGCMANKAIEHLADDPVVIEANADRQAMDKNNMVAMMEYQRALSLSKNSDDSLRLRNKIAWVFLDSSQFFQAESMFEALTGENSKDASCWEGFGLTLLSLGKTEQARKAFKNAIGIDGKCWKSLNGLGVIHNIGKNPDIALSMFGRALDIKPMEPEIFNNQGLAYILKKDFPKAEASFKQALQFRPDYRLAINNLAILYMLTGRMPESLASFENSVGIHGAYNNIGALLYLKGDPVRAEEYFKKAIETSPLYYPLANDNLDFINKSK